MKRTFFAVLMLGIILSLTGCGGGGSNPPPSFVVDILSDPAFDGDIEETSPGVFAITQGMSSTVQPPVQSVFAGIDPVTGTETRAFLAFPLRAAGGVPFGGIIQSATLEIFIDTIQPAAGTIPIRIDLVSFEPQSLALVASDFDRVAQPALASTTFSPPIGPADVGQPVTIDVTALVAQAQALHLQNFQVRILEELGVVPAGLIEIDDTTGINRGHLAPLLTVTYRWCMPDGEGLRQLSHK